MTETKETAIQGREYQGVSIPPVGTYELDPVHTVVGFVARHMLSKVRGQFTEFSGTIEVGESPLDSHVDVEAWGDRAGRTGRRRGPLRSSRRRCRTPGRPR